MKLNVFLAMLSQSKTAVISLAVLVSSVVGGGFYASTPDGQNIIQRIVRPIPQAAAQSPATEKLMTLTPSSPTETSVFLVKEPAQSTIKKTAEATTQETTAKIAATEATIEETTETKEATAEATTQATAQAIKKTAVQPQTQPSKPQTAVAPAAPAATTAAPVATTAAPAATTAAPVATTAAAPVAMGDLSGSFNDDMARAVLDLVNQQRTAAGLAGLSWSGTLASSAKVRAPEIVVKWSHTRPDGSAWYTAGSQMQMGENLASGQSSASQAVSEWMASAGHAENVLRTSFTQMGVSCYYCNGNYYWVQHFA